MAGSLENRGKLRELIDKLQFIMLRLWGSSKHSDPWNSWFKE